MRTADKREKRRLKRQKQEARAMKKAERLAAKDEAREAAERKYGPVDPKRSFFKTFLAALLVFIIILIPVGILANNWLETSPFADPGEDLDGDGEPDNLDDVKFEVLVDPNSVFFEEFSDSERINMLLLGVNPPLTDTIMLASFDPKTKHVDVISVPRDTYYPREGYSGDAESKINAAFKGNALNSAKAVSEILCGIPINYYAVVEYDDVKAIVDEMGGVPMYIEKNLDYDDEWDTPPLHIHIQAGEQVLNGEDSVKFLRYRKGYAMGDLGRVEAQQTWVKNAMSKAIDHGIMKVADVAFKEIESNITYKAMLKLGTMAVGISAEDIATYTIPHTLQDGPPYFVYADAEGIEGMLREIYSIAPETTTDAAISTDGAVTTDAAADAATDGAAE